LTVERLDATSTDRSFDRGGASRRDRSQHQDVMVTGYAVATKSGTRILVVEDDPEMRSILQRMLEAEGCVVQSASNASTTLAAATEFQPDLILMDVELGADDGRDILHTLRQDADTPIIFVTGRGLEMDRIAGLRMGADDYVVKPISRGELSARIESVLRRSRAAFTRHSPGEPMVFEHLRIDPLTREVARDGELIDLTTKEFDLLAFLASSPRQVFSRQQLLQHVWSSSSEWQDDATVTEHIRRLRRKIELSPETPRVITTVRGVGYRFELSNLPADPDHRSVRGTGT
jgi:two-component system, OmpR family, phosphate regulon response regulator PhoB